MKTIRVHILQKRGWLADIQQKNVDIAGVKNIAERRPATGLQGQFLKTCLLRDFVEGAVTIVTMQQQRLPKSRTGFQSVNLGIDMAVRDQNVEPRVVVHIKKRRAPAYVKIAGLADSRGPTALVKTHR